ncbi:hypothetical protein [Pseudomonas sp. NPDC007930]|uniref:hypothetical protein n=1 Tax=Pseudomonas sp. NPDC007930 TaxID=3364417 RepID=UPI0036E126AA
MALVGVCASAQAGALPEAGDLDEGIAARCLWGKSIAGLAQEKLLKGVSRKDFMVSLDQLHYSRGWQPRMSQAIADSVYRSSATTSVSSVKEQYLNDCHQYYLAK